MEIPFVLLPLEYRERVAACVRVERRRKREAKIDGEVGAGMVNKLALLQIQSSDDGGNLPVA